MSGAPNAFEALRTQATGPSTLAPVIPGTAATPMRVYNGGDLDVAGMQAHPNPSPAQKVAGNYALGHAKVQGLPIAIETPRGGTRSGVGPDGKPWSVTMPVHYGYVKGTKGMDGDALDVFLGPSVASQRVFAIDQVHADTKKPDEHKFLLGFKTPEEAAQAYHGSFSDGKGPQRVGAATELTMNEFKSMVGRARVKAMRQPVAK